MNRARSIFSTILPLKINKEIFVSPREMLRHKNPYTKILIDNRPTDYECALLSQHVYRGNTLKKGDCLLDNKKWKIDQVKEGKWGYFGAIYINDEIQQVVLAHRGTDSSHIAPDENTSKLLTKRWQENKIPEEIIQYLQSYRVENDSSGIEKIVLEDSANVHYFQQELSNWLLESGYSIDKLIGVNVTSPAKRLLEQWNVPAKNSNFIGRSRLLRQIEDHFSQNTTPAILTACHGLGGIGKTQVALEFVWQHYKKYNGVVWFNAESRDQLQNEYIILGRELSIIRDNHNINAKELACKVKRWFEDSSRAGWLLVYDNADNYKDVRELLPTKGGKILITSRHTADWPLDISIDVFTIEESRAYIQKVLDIPISESNIVQIETLAETLGRLPLALAQATAYIKRNKMIISDYLEYYKQKKSHLLNSKILPSDYHASVFITWDITMEAIRKESLLAANLLNICACLASNDIPKFLLKKFANNPEKTPILSFSKKL